MRSRMVLVGFVLIVALALVTGSVLLVGYAAAAASLLIIVTLLARKAVRGRSASPIPLDVAEVGRFRRPGGGMTVYAAEEVFARPERERRTDSSRETRSPHAAARQQQQLANVDQVLDDSFPASDPPSWTGAISRVAATSTAPSGQRSHIRRVRAEFLEMPGLCLTLDQAQRLWGLEPRTCEALLKFIDRFRVFSVAPAVGFSCCPGQVGSAGFQNNSCL